MDDMTMGQLPKAAATSYGGALLQNYQNLFEGIVSSDGINSAGAAASSQIVLSSNNLPLKRTLPSLYWSDDQDHSSRERLFQLDGSHDESLARKDGINGTSTSVNGATLLSQPSLHQQVMLGSTGDSVFRAPCHLPGLNWYS